MYIQAPTGRTSSRDAVGNPLNDGAWTYQRQAGRQLKRMSAEGAAVSFQYDHNGLRVANTVNGAATKYALHEKLITHMPRGNDKLHFFYDEQSRTAEFGGVKYTCVHNLQGDILFPENN